MCTQALVTSSKRWTWFTEEGVGWGLRQEGDNGHCQTEHNQSENHGASDFILFRFCMVVV